MSQLPLTPCPSVRFTWNSAINALNGYANGFNDGHKKDTYIINYLCISTLKSVRTDTFLSVPTDAFASVASVLNLLTIRGYGFGGVLLVSAFHNCNVLNIIHLPNIGHKKDGRTQEKAVRAKNAYFGHFSRNVITVGNPYYKLSFNP